MATPTTPMTPHVIGGFHDGAAFLPGAASKQDVEDQIAQVRDAQHAESLREKGRRLDEIEAGFRMIADRRQKKYHLD